MFPAATYFLEMRILCSCISLGNEGFELITIFLEVRVLQVVDCRLCFAEVEVAYSVGSELEHAELRGAAEVEVHVASVASLTAPLKLMGSEVTMSLSRRKRKRADVKPLVKMSAQ